VRFLVRKSVEQLFSALSLAFDELLYKKCLQKMLMKLTPLDIKTLKNCSFAVKLRDYIVS